MSVIHLLNGSTITTNEEPASSWVMILYMPHRICAIRCAQTGLWWETK